MPITKITCSFDLAVALLRDMYNRGDATDKDGFFRYFVELPAGFRARYNGSEDGGYWEVRHETWISGTDRSVLVSVSEI